MKLGEALVREGLITREQLNRALERQVMFGGRIGTNLLELRFMHEEELTMFLSRYFRISAVSPELIASIPDEVLSSLDREIVEKYKILPFSRERKRLYAAMINPAALDVIDELRFVTGYDIIPHVISEMRFIFALEKYYGIKPELRYISLQDPFSSETVIEEKDAIEKIKTAFTDVRGVEEIAGILLKEGCRIASRVAAFIMKGEKVKGWKARGLDVEGFETSGKEGSIFFEVLMRRHYYRGPVLKIPGNEALIAVLSGTPQDALLMPITVRDKAVAFLYVDNGNNAVLNANIAYLSRLASIAAVAFELIILRKRIMEM